MPRINLLPAKRIARMEDLAREVRWAVILTVAAIAALGCHALAQASYLATRQDELVQLNSESETLQDKVHQIDRIKNDLSVVGKKLAVIEALRNSKMGPSRLLGGLAQVLAAHPRVWLTQFDEQDDSVKLSGNAMAQEDISHFQVALGRQASLFASVTLLLVSSGKAGSDHILEWSMSGKLAATPPAVPK